MSAKPSNIILAVERHPLCWAIAFVPLGWLCLPYSFNTAYVLVFALLFLTPLLWETRRLPVSEIGPYCRAYFNSMRGQRIILAICSMSVFICLFDAITGYFKGDFTLIARIGVNLSWLFIAPFIYFIVFILTFLAAKFLQLRNKRLQASGTSLDLRRELRRLGGPQAGVQCALLLFMSTFVCSVFLTVCANQGPIDMIANWLAASANDAAMPGMEQFYQCNIPELLNGRLPIMASQYFHWVQFVRLIAFIIFTSALWGRALDLAVFLTDVLRRCVVDVSQSNLWAIFINHFAQKLHQPDRQLILQDGNAWLRNISRTVCWLGLCYLTLLFIFGLSGGPIGVATQSMMFDSVRDAGFDQLVLTPNDTSRLRLFLGAIYALYGTVPLAVTSCVFLANARARKITIGADGLVCPSGFMSVPLRLWSDFESVELTASTLRVKFFSGGAFKIKTSKLKAKDLDELLGAIDEHCPRCQISDEVSALRRALQPGLVNEISSAPTGDCSLVPGKISEYKSTIFVPAAPGDYLQTELKIRVVRVLSTRPLSAAYLVRTAEGRLAIVKQFVLSGPGAELKALKKTFLREHQLLQGLDHSAIAKVLAVFEAEQSTYLMLEYWPGQDLRMLVSRDGALPEAVVLDFAAQLCASMRYLHSRPQPVIHRDLTPDNIVVDESGRIRLIDFGAAKEFLAGVTGTLIGKQNYMPAEQIRGEANPRSDVYSFGCTLHFLLTGRDPRALSVSSPLSLNPAVGSALDSLIRSCTAFDDKDRPLDFAEIEAQIQRIALSNCGTTIKIPEAIAVVSL